VPATGSTAWAGQWSEWQEPIASGSSDNLAGHGVGRALHENPEEIVSYYRPGDRRVLREGMVLAVEPFLSTRATAAYEADDGWTLCTAPGNFSAQYEHTLIVTRGRPIVVTTPHA
jgi:methionyl aminopeptidase